MPFRTISVAATLSSTALSTWFDHYFTNKPPASKPTSQLSYHEGLEVIREFLYYASHQTVEDFQAFTARAVPPAPWAKNTNVVIPPGYLASAARLLISQLGPDGISRVGGHKWWQWRGDEPAFRGQWIETRADYNERRRIGSRPKRVILYIHGGAYYFGSADTHRYQLQRHARKLKAGVFAPKFRLAPQFPFPCGLQDCIAAYLYLLAVHRPEEIIIAGDSSGGGMALSVLVTLRDQKIPLPAGAVLISPWVDLMHSFPSITEGNTQDDYLPPYSFMHKPSMTWPPPSTDEIATVTRNARRILQSLNSPPVVDGGKVADRAAEDYYTRQARFAAHPGRVDPLPPSQTGRDAPVSPYEIPLTVQVNGQTVQIKDQIHMYTTNHLLSHPLVSPVLQPSLGGLPPMLIIVGGGEMLRDEQIYIAHKAANPERYPPSEKYLNLYDPTRRLISKYPPTYVQLQVWDDLCHVPTTLSFTRPAKLIFRAIAQFEAWAFSHAQNCSIDICDGDEISDSGNGNEDPLPWNFPKASQAGIDTVGKAGDPLPPFHNHMIRQRVDRRGNIHPLPVEAAIPALNMRRSDIGEAKAAPLYRWMAAKQKWDAKYAKRKQKVQDRRIEELLLGIEELEPGQLPPPSSLAARRGVSVRRVRKPLAKKSRALTFWNKLGAKDDEKQLREESRELSKSAMSWRSRRRDNEGTELSRRATFTRTVTDTGQANEDDTDIRSADPGPSNYSPRQTEYQPEIAVHGPEDEGYSTYEPNNQQYMRFDSTIPETPLERPSYWETPAIPQRSACRLERDTCSTRAVHNAEGVISPRPESSSSQLAWQTPRESVSYVGRRTLGEMDGTPVLPMTDSRHMLQVPARSSRRHRPAALEPIVNGVDSRVEPGADADPNTRSIVNTSGIIEQREWRLKGKEIAYDLHSIEQERVPSDTEPFPAYSMSGMGNLSRAPSGYSSEYSVHA